MFRTGKVYLPLHNGRCPRWLFPRMERLSSCIAEAIILEHGQNEFLRRLSDPYFFQSLGCVVGYDWHASGLSTTLTAALKSGINDKNLGIKIAGGKGKTSRKAPKEIEDTANTFSLSNYKIERLKYASKMTAKVDNNLIQCNPPYQLYHHAFIFTEKGEWCVIQQGMNTENGYARRYHWLSDNVSSFVEEPHNAICGNKEKNVLDMTNKESEEARKVSVDIVNDNPEHLIRYMKTTQTTLINFEKFTMPRKHTIYLHDLTKRTVESLKKAYEIQPTDYEELVALKGIGPKSIRALALVSELIYGAKPSWKDPCKYAFAHGGKDGFPFPVDREKYDLSINLLEDAIKQAKLSNKEKLNAIRRLNNFI